MYRKSDFPALGRLFEGEQAVFLDGPAGTQVPTSVIDTISSYYKTKNANTHGYFWTTRETDELIASTRSTVAEFLGAPGPETISFGQNMTTLTYSLARAIGHGLREGDEILITQLDHEANRGPWLQLRRAGLVVREINLLPNGQLDYDDLQNKLNEKTRLLAMGWASNLTGTINDVKLARQMTRKVGAWLLLDAVHYAPHFLPDVTDADCDFLLCSAYKFYGPHVGILYSRPGLLDRLSTECLRTSDQVAPYKIETGTLNHAALAGVRASIEYMASYGSGDTLRQRLHRASEQLIAHESKLIHKLIRELEQMERIAVVGPGTESKRAPTVSFVHRLHRPDEVCRLLNEHKIFAWDGHFYALRAVEVLGLLPKGGVTRMGISGYTKEEDIDRVVHSLRSLSEQPRLSHA